MTSKIDLVCASGFKRQDNNGMLGHHYNLKRLPAIEGLLRAFLEVADFRKLTIGCHIFYLGFRIGYFPCLRKYPFILLDASLVNKSVTLEMTERSEMNFLAFSYKLIFGSNSRIISSVSKSGSPIKSKLSRSIS